MSNDDVQFIEFTINDYLLVNELSQSYLGDLAMYNTSLKRDSHGYYDNNYFNIFFSDERHIPLALIVNQKIIGFIMLSVGKAVDYIIQDFYISQDYRKKGIGHNAMKQIFSSYSGKYGFDVLPDNVPAINFWRAVLQKNGFKWDEKTITSDGVQVIRMITE